MFTLFDDCLQKIYLVGTDNCFAVAPHHQGDASAEMHSVVMSETVGNAVLFSGSQTECKRFLELLFFALRDCKGAQVDDLARAAVEYAKKQTEAAQ